MGFSRQEYWSGLPVPPPGDCPDLGIWTTSPASTGGFFITESPGEPLLMTYLTDKQSIQARIPKAQDYWYIGVDCSLLWGVLFTGGCLPASLVSIHESPGASFPAHENQIYLQTLSVQCRPREKAPWRLQPLLQRQLHWSSVSFLVAWGSHGGRDHGGREGATVGGREPRCRARTTASASPISKDDALQGPWSIPETMDGTKPYVCCVLSYTCIPVIKINL